tara:strand:+ start:18343 stop:18870 length:528 start_codon:yes stop_codon:yes gene_type:complete
MKTKILFLFVLLMQSISPAGVVESALCKQFYLNDRAVTVLDIIKKQATDNITFSVESYYPYLSKLFPEFSDVEMIMLMAIMRPGGMTYTQISTKGVNSPRSQFYSNYTPTRLVVSRRLLKSSGSSEITLNNVQALANVLNKNADKPEAELYRQVRERLVDGLRRGFTTSEIISAL